MSGNSFSLKAENLNWICGLSSLKVLDLGGVGLSNAENWLDAVNLLLNLVELRLFFCKLHKLPLNLPHVNFTSLKILDLLHWRSYLAPWGAPQFFFKFPLEYIKKKTWALQELNPPLPHIIFNN